MCVRPRTCMARAQCAVYTQVAEWIARPEWATPDDNGGSARGGHWLMDYARPGCPPSVIYGRHIQKNGMPWHMSNEVIAHAMAATGAHAVTNCHNSAPPHVHVHTHVHAHTYRPAAYARPLAIPTPVVRGHDDAQVMAKLNTAGVRRVIVGHTPHGNCPTVIKSAGGSLAVQVVMADTSYSDMSCTDNRGAAVSTLSVRPGGGALRVEGVL